MDFSMSVTAEQPALQPVFLDQARKLADEVAKMSPQELAGFMSISENLAAQTHEKFASWGKPGQPQVPVLFGFTGMIFKHLDAPSLSPEDLAFAGEHLRILSGLYGLLAPFDLIEAYRLEMGYKLAVDGASNLIQFWKQTLTERLNKEMPPGAPILSLASQEYMKALDLKKLDHPVITAVFKEQRPDGSFKNVVVHAKKARGAFVRYAIQNRARQPRDLANFSAMGWGATQQPPEEGPWLFTRPAE